MPIPLVIWVIAAATTAIVGAVSTGVAASRIQDTKDKYKKKRKNINTSDSFMRR